MPRNIFLKAMSKVNQNKYAEKAKNTKEATARLPEMQAYVSKSEEKRKLLIQVLHEDNDKILKAGAIVYAGLVESAETILKDLEEDGIECVFIRSKLPTAKRKEIADWFKDNPNNKVVIITEAAAQSISLNATNNIIFYEMPRGSGKYSQACGRVVRNFGNFNEFNIHFISVEETIDEYKQILLSSKKELEMEILHADMIQMKEEAGQSFSLQLLKKVRERLLWKKKKNKS